MRQKSVDASHHITLQLDTVTDTRSQNTHQFTSLLPTAGNAADIAYLQ